MNMIVCHSVFKGFRTRVQEVPAKILRIEDNDSNTQPAMKAAAELMLACVPSAAEMVAC